MSPLTTKARRELARAVGMWRYREGTLDFAMFKHWWLVSANGEPLAIFSVEREAVEFMGLSGDPALSLAKVPYLFRRRHGPLFDDEVPPPSRRVEKEPS